MIEKNARPGWFVSEREASVSASPIVSSGNSGEEEPRRRGGRGDSRGESNEEPPGLQPAGNRRCGGLSTFSSLLRAPPRTPRLRGSSRSSSYRQLRQGRVDVLDLHRLAQDRVGDAAVDEEAHLVGEGGVARV